MADQSKDTIYIDIDDEITGIIDKLNASPGKVVALVLPKRAAVFQSIINMKLLKRAADESKKNLVLITSEAGLLPLAGAAGVHVAKTLTSKPSVPLAPQAIDDGEETVAETDEPEEITAETAGDQPVGSLAAGLGAAAAANDVETLELDDDEAPEDAATPKPKDFTPPAKKAKKDKKLKIPNFNRFRMWLMIGGLILLLIIIGIILALTALPKATIKIKTDAVNIPVNLNVNASTNASSFDPSSNTLPAKVDSQVKTYTQQVPTTGQKNEGQKASGTISNVDGGACSSTAPPDIPAGAGASSNGLTYITQDDITFQPVLSRSHQCSFQGVDADTGQASIPVQAQSGGSNYNVSGVPFTVSGHSATGSASGGTDNIVQVVNQNDINNAKSKISTNNDATQKQALANQLQQEGYYAITSTFSSGTPNVTSSANVGETANNVTVTEVVTYTMFGVHKSDLKTLVDNAVNTQIDTSKQSILSEGLDTAQFGVNNINSSNAQLTMQATAEAGPEIDVNTLKQQAAGKKPGDVKSTIGNDPDVTGVDVKLSPFWVTSVPKKTSRITVNIAKPTTTAKSNAANQ